MLWYSRTVAAFIKSEDEKFFAEWKEESRKVRDVSLKGFVLTVNYNV